MTGHTATWTEAHRIEEEGVVVTINQSDHEPPRYAYFVDFQTAVGRNLRFHRVQFVRDQAGKIKITRFADAIANTVETAEDWIEAKIQEDSAVIRRSDGMDAG